MTDLFTRLFDPSGFVPRRTCGDWTPGLVWLHNASDALIWLAYLAIPLVLLVIARRRKDVPFRAVYVLFVAFILTCGFTHFLDVVMFYSPLYRLSGLVKAMTAVASWATVIALVPVLPKALAMRGPEELEREITERRRVEGELRALHAELEERVRLRTAQLEEAVVALRAGNEERKRVEGQLWASREQLRLVTDNAPVMLVHCDAERRYKFVNRAYAECFGLTPSEVMGRTITEVVGERGYERIRADVDAALAGERVEREVEGPYQGTDKRWHHLTCLPTYSQSGEVDGAIAVMLDVTDRRKAEGLLRSITDTIPALLTSVDVKGRYRLNNRAYEQWFGQPRSGMEGRHMRDVLGEAAWAVVGPKIEAALTGQTVSYESQLPYQFGGMRWVDATYTPHHDLGGDIDGVVVLVNDITDRKEAETALRTSEARFRMLLEGVPQLVWTCLPDGRCDYLSRQWVDYTGVPEAGQLGYGWMERLHADDRKLVQERWQHAVEIGGPLDVEFRIRSAGGEYRWFKTRAVRFTQEDGSGKWFGTNTDIHDRKLAEDGLRDLNARLEERVAESLRQRLDERRRAEEALFGTRAQLLDAIESLDAGFVMYGPDEKMVICNAKYKEIYAECAHAMVPDTPYEEVLRAFVRGGAVAHTGLSEEEWVGQRLHAHRHPGEPVEQWLSGKWIRISDRLTSSGGVVSLRTDITALKHAQQAAEERSLDLARSEQALRHQKDILTSILNSMGDAVIVADRDGKFLVFNSAAERMLGTSSMDALPEQWPDVYGIYLPDAETPAPASYLPLVKAMQGEETNDIEMVLCSRHRPERAHVIASGRPLRGGANGDGGGVVVIHDITARKLIEEQMMASLREKEVLLKEIHHRVKNNLQIVSALLDLQSGHSADPAVVRMFQETQGRVKSMALIHERLYRSQDMAKVDFSEYALQLTSDLYRTYKVSDDDIRLELDVDIPPLAIDTAIPVGLLLNELISNCFKHAFAAAAEGCLRVSLRRDGGANVLTVADDGAGFPAGTDFRNTTSFGLQLVNTLVDQLDGEISLATDRGTTFTVRFPRPSTTPAGTLP